MAGAPDPPPRFSILLPTHNQRHLLTLALRSALAQTFQEFELLVVADGCTDDTADAVRALGDPRLRLFDLPKAPGFGYANRNVALREARGDLVAFLAHDDLYFPDHLELMDRAFRDADAAWACTRPLIVESDGSFHPASRNLHVPSHLRDFLEGRFVPPASTIVYRAELHRSFGGWPESIERAGDREFWARLVRGAGIERLRFIPEPTTLHFRAPWRRDLRAAGARPGIFQEPYPDPWPLIVDPARNPVEQEVFLEAMQADPLAWTERVRRDVQAVLDGRLTAFDALRAAKRQRKREQRLKQTADAPDFLQRLSLRRRRST